jgi:CBS domain-containing protein
LSVHEAEPEILVRDIMSRPPITAKETDSVMVVSKLMVQRNIGCVIILDKAGKPSGIITERDIVQRIAASDLVPSNVKVLQIMSKPIVSVSPGISVNDAAKEMNHKRIRRLAIVEGGKLVGIVTMKDILEVTPTLIDLISEKNQAGLRTTKTPSGLAGYCDECETWSERLIQKEGVFLCADCSKDLGPTEEG